MPRTGPVLALVVLAPLLLAGCSGSPAASSSSSRAVSTAPSSAAASQPATTSAPSASASSSGSTDGVVSGTGYRFPVPDGWGKPQGVDAPQGTDSFAAALDDADGFADNVNVIALPTGAVTPQAAEEQAPAGLKQIGATKVTVADRETVAGETAAHLSASLTSSGQKYRVDQFYVPHDGKTYVVTFSFSPGVSASDRSAVYSPSLAGWAWS